MENEETTTDAALRETVEEAGARIGLNGLFSLMNLPSAHQVHLFYRATLLDINFMPGVETSETKLFAKHEIPWSQLAFSTIKYALELYFDDQGKIAQGGSYGFHSIDILDPQYPG